MKTMYVCVCVCVCIHACKPVHVFYFPDIYSHIICHRIIQCFHFSSKYLFIIPSVSPSPDILLHKLVEALWDTSKSDLRKSQTVLKYFSDVFILLNPTFFSLKDFFFY